MEKMIKRTKRTMYEEIMKMAWRRLWSVRKKLHAEETGRILFLI